MLRTPCLLGRLVCRQANSRCAALPLARGHRRCLRCRLGPRSLPHRPRAAQCRKSILPNQKSQFHKPQRAVEHQSKLALSLAEENEAVTQRYNEQVHNAAARTCGRPWVHGVVLGSGAQRCMAPRQHGEVGNGSGARRCMSPSPAWGGRQWERCRPCPSRRAGRCLRQRLHASFRSNLRRQCRNPRPQPKPLFLTPVQGAEVQSLRRQVEELRGHIAGQVGSPLGPLCCAWSAHSTPQHAPAAERPDGLHALPAACARALAGGSDRQICTHQQGTRRHPGPPLPLPTPPRHAGCGRRCRQRGARCLQAFGPGDPGTVQGGTQQHAFFSRNLKKRDNKSFKMIMSMHTKKQSRSRRQLTEEAGGRETAAPFPRLAQRCLDSWPPHREAWNALESGTLCGRPAWLPCPFRVTRARLCGRRPAWRVCLPGPGPAAKAAEPASMAPCWRAASPSLR